MAPPPADVSNDLGTAISAGTDVFCMRDTFHVICASGRRLLAHHVLSHQRHCFHDGGEFVPTSCSLSPDGPFQKSGLDRQGADSDIHHGVDC